MTHHHVARATQIHPLVRTLARPLNRRSMALGGASAAVLGRFRPVRADSTSATPGTLSTPDAFVQGEEDAVALLEAAADALAELDTFAFELETSRGRSTLLEGFELKRVEGVVRRPLDVQATVTMGLPIGELSITAIGLDGEFWVQDPLNDGKWISLGSDRQIQSLINPDMLILLAVRLVQDARIVGSEKVDGAAATMVEGRVDFSAMLDSLPPTAEGSAQLREYIAEGSREVTFWIDEENRVIEAEIRGPIFVTESDDVVRVLSLFNFNMPVEIELPEGV